MSQFHSRTRSIVEPGLRQPSAILRSVQWSSNSLSRSLRTRENSRGWNASRKNLTPRLNVSRLPIDWLARNSIVVATFVDTNVLLYAISTAEEEVGKRAIARRVLLRTDLAFSVQVLQEFYVQATRSSAGRVA